MRIPAWNLLALGAPLVFTACATIGPPQPPSLELPKAPVDLRAVRKGDQVVLTWTIPTVTTDRQTVRSFGSTRICRGVDAELTECGSGVGETNARPNPSSARSSRQKPVGSYTDVLSVQMESDNPAAFATYAVEVRNADGRSAGLSNRVKVPLVRTLPAPPDFRARVTNQGVVLNWTSDSQTGAQSPVRYVYRVSRRLEENAQWILAGELPAGGEGDVALTDSSFEWEKTYEYRVDTTTVVSSAPETRVEGDDSPEVKVFAHDVFPPAVPSGLQAVFSGPGQKAFIDLIWAPVADVDLDGYNVYRHEEGAAAVKVNAEPVKSPAYRDVSVASGKSYLYSVSAVDVRGNESARSEEAGESVP